MKLIGKKVKSFRKKDLKNLSIGRAIAILENREKLIEGKKKSKVDLRKIDEEFKEKIKKISKMNIFDYLRHINGNEDEENESDSSTKDENIEDKIDSFEELIKENKDIKYKKIRINNY